MNNVSALISSLRVFLPSSFGMIQAVRGVVENVFQRTVVDNPPEDHAAPLTDRISPAREFAQSPVRSPVRPPSPASKIVLRVLREGEPYISEREVQRLEFDLFVDPASADSALWKKKDVSLITAFSEEARHMRYPIDSGENRRHAVITIEGKWIYKDEKWEQLLQHIEKEWLTKPLRESLENDLKRLFYEIAEKLQLQKRKAECDVLIVNQEAALEMRFVAPQLPVNEILDEFFRQLAIYCRDERAHPLAVAAFIHWSICRIRPFEDGNGSVARLYMNIWLMQRGYQPLVVRTQDDYLKPFQEKDYIQAFGNYLSEHL